MITPHVLPGGQVIMAYEPHPDGFEPELVIPDPPIPVPPASVFQLTANPNASSWLSVASATVAATPVPAVTVPGMFPAYDDASAVNWALGIWPRVILVPGTYTFQTPVVLNTPGQVVEGGGWGTVIQQGSAFTGSALFQPKASQTRISNLAAVCSTASFCDFTNTSMNYFWADQLNVTSSGGADMWTGANLHRSTIRDCLFTQTGPANSIWAMGAGSVLATTNFDRIVSLVSCDPNAGTRSAPAWSIQLATNKNVDVVRFFQCVGINQITNGLIDSTQYFYDVACNANAANNDFDRISWLECDFGQVLGGAIRVQSVAGVFMDKVTCGNVFAQAGKSLSASLIRVQTSGGSGQHCNAVHITNYLREGSAAMGSGVDPSDISVSADTTEVTVTNAARADSGGGQPVQVNLNGCPRALVQQLDPGGIILNQNSTAGQQTIVIGNGAITLGGTAYTNP